MSSKSKTYAILGLGIFGSTIAKALSDYNYEIIAIDRDITCVDRIAEFATNAVQADITDIDQLRSIGIQDVDVAVVATGSHLEDSIMAIMNLRELGVPYILAKAKNKKYMQIFEKIGADRVIRPEKEMGERVAKQLISRNIVDLIDIDQEYSVVEIIAPESWTNKSLKNLNLRANYGINILGIRKKPGEHLSISPDAEYIIEPNDRLLVIADNAVFKKFDKNFNR
ncbi:potassium channel family protein [Anaerorhabdus furcosa]|uniref:Trk system potassium uptake protein TrkA n=1 Tax=Anaerorhabdus furcosa TaxID=118967 RepID=A0A1T4QD32_9FIRM|nr:TrkA family potassium uptake protein [Anaerorhabdus furcosa]SKA01693.1 trk system potassium uptake protein TrkA [Anaerorhabdus furcosa]